MFGQYQKIEQNVQPETKKVRIIFCNFCWWTILQCLHILHLAVVMLLNFVCNMLVYRAFQMLWYYLTYLSVSWTWPLFPLHIVFITSMHTPYSHS